MQRYYYDNPDPHEREPLDNPYNPQYPPAHQQPPNQGYQEQQTYGHQDYASPPSRSGLGAFHPGAHPDSAFHRSRPIQPGSHQEDYQQQSYLPATQPSESRPHPPPPPIRPNRNDGQYRAAGYPPQTNITPGADNFGDSASGGMAAIAYTVAERNQRESGVEAMRNVGAPQPGSGYSRSVPQHHQPGQVPVDRSAPRHGRGRGHGVDSHSSDSSLTPLDAVATSTGRRSPSRSPHGFATDPFADDPYQAYASSRGHDPRLGMVNPNEIEDDGDEGLDYRRPARNSMLSLHSNRSGNNSSRSGHGVGAAAAVGGAMGAVGGLASRTSNRSSTAQYDPVHNSNNSSHPGGGVLNESSRWLEKENKGKKKWKLAIIIGVLLLIIGGIVAGVVAGIVGKQGGGNGGQSADDDFAKNGDLTKDSAEIKELMSNKKLHKVFPGMDYTPINTQYPECIKNPPSQNNVTRDVAVLSRLTNTLRLYGNDCNQTQMVIHAIDRLGLKNEMKLWMGVWQDKDTETNARQLDQVWDILKESGTDPFVGVIVANEILFRQEMTIETLSTVMSKLRKELKEKGFPLPVATSDLGDNWNAYLANQSDYIMSNIHPFFAGQPAAGAADWTLEFFKNKNQDFFKSDPKLNVISEIGWPTQGGTNCGPNILSCPGTGSVAGVDELNTLMQDWVCKALDAGTPYFWFSAFDEPWKARFNEKEKGREWEDQWGIMDVNRKVKDGVVIPDCGGRTV